jgi:Cu/Ag efflux protein CusF
MKSTLLLAAAAFVLAAPSFAQSGMPAANAQASVANEYTQGEVRKIENGRVLLKHGEIKNLGMPPMAMMFDVKNPKMLDKLKVGDKVRFRARFESGKYVLTDIEPAK